MNSPFLAVLTLVAVAAAPVHAFAQAPAVTAGTDFVATSAYVWRGFVPSDGFNVQPSTWLRAGDLTITSWSNVTGPSKGISLTEHDLTVDYSKRVGRYTVSGGWVNYAFTTGDAASYSNELYAGVAFASYLNPAVRVFRDIGEGSGTYVSLGISHDYAMGSRGLVTPSVTLGYNHEQWIEGSRFSDVTFGMKAKLPTPVRRLWVAPFVAWSQSLATSLFPNRLYGGFGISVQ